MKTKKLFALLLAALLLALAAPTAFAADLGGSVSAESPHYAAGNTVEVPKATGNAAADRENLQNALNQGAGASEAAPLTVKVPAGAYVIDKALKIYSNTTLTLDAKTTITRDKNSTQGLLRSAYQHTAVEGTWTGTEGGYDQLKNVTIEGGTWNGNADDKKQKSDGFWYSSKEPVNLLFFWHGDNITIQNTTIRECVGDHFLELSAVRNSKVQNVKFVDFIRANGTDYNLDSDAGEVEDGLAGTAKRSEAIQLDFAGKENSPLSYPFDKTGCKNITVDSCTFENCQSGVGTHHWDVAMTDFTITNNTFTNMGSACICLPNMQNVTVKNNTAKNARAFARVNYGGQATFTNNTVTYGYTSAAKNIQQDTFFIAGSKTNVTLDQNKAYGSGKRAVMVMDGAAVTLTGNTFDLSSFQPKERNGVHVENAASVAASDNQITKATDHGFYLCKTSGTLQNNTIDAPAGNGVLLESCTAKVTISGNKIVSAKNNGINATGSTVTVSKNTITSPKGNGIYTEKSALTAKSNKITSPAGQGVYLKTAKASTVSGNTVTAAGKNGLYLEGASGKVTLQDNTVSKAVGHAILVEKSTFVASGNTLTNPGKSGIYASNVSSLTIDGNTITGGGKGSNSIELNGCKGKVTKNTISGSGSCGLRIRENSNISEISGNTISKSADKGVSVKSSTVTVSGSNNITDSKTYGIYLEDAKFTVKNNVIRGSGKYDIGAFGKSSGSITDNTIDTKGIFVKQATGTITQKNNTTKLQTTPKPAETLAAPKLSSVQNTSTGVKVAWKKVSGAEKYQLYYKTTGGWKSIGTTTKTSYTWTKAKAGTKYAFTVKAVKGKTASSYDKKGLSITYVQQSNVSKVENTTSGIKITWKKSSGAAKYMLYYKTTGGWKKIGTTTKTSYTWKKAKSGTKYAFTIKALAKDGSAASYNNGKSITYLSAPTKLAAAKSGSTGIKVSWGKVTGAAKYRVFYKTGSGSWKKLKDVTSTSYTWKSAKKGTQYAFTVRAIAKDGKTMSAYDTKGKSVKR